MVVIDEAHLLDAPTHGSLAAVVELRARWLPGMTLLLVGQPSILPLMGRMPAWDERLAVKCLLRSFQPPETAAYVEHRLRVAGTVRSSNRRPCPRSTFT